MNENRNSFKGSIGFVLAAAGSAVGLGNIWRFPYLAAKDGGGLFLVIYIVLALTFGFTLLTTEIAIGRKTKQSPLTAYSKLKSKWKPLGIIACIVPIMIFPYYVTIGGWVLKYLLVYITGNGHVAAQDGYFSGFISQTAEPIIMMLVLTAVLNHHQRLSCHYLLCLFLEYLYIHLQFHIQTLMAQQEQVYRD